MSRFDTCVLPGLVICFASTAAWGQAAPLHPLDPLSAAEYRQTVALLHAAGHVDTATRYPIITLREPAKDAVLRWIGGGPQPDRAAEAVVRRGSAIYEATVDLSRNEVTEWKRVEGGESSLLLEDFGAAQEAALASPEMVSALAKRGVTDLERVFCAPFTMGHFNIPEDEGMRLLKVGCMDLRPSENNMFGWPIEGLYAIVDLNQGTAVRVRDSGVIPITKTNMNFTERSVARLRDRLKPVEVEQPLGRNFSADGHTVRWQNWKFHFRIDRRYGPVMSLVTYRDGERDRSILYQGVMSEMFVPYMDPDYGWYSRTYFDMGEYGVGLMLTALAKGVDCPRNATFWNATISDDEGSPIEMPNVICLFERNSGNPIWRHAEVMNETYEGRPDVELVVRVAAQIGNYDYIIDWVFNLAGEIDVMVGSTGIDALKGVKATSMQSPTAREETRYGTLVAPNLVAVYHDHYFNFRLDIDVDGPVNRFERDVYTPERLPANHPRRSLYRIVPQVATTDSDAKYNRGPTPSKWRVVSARTTNAVGNPTSLEIVPKSDSKVLLSHDDYVFRRAMFTEYDFWVTPYAPGERYAAGKYVFQSEGGGGLPAWTQHQRSVRDTDIVVWHTVGMHHMTRSEDVPVMPLVWRGFKLRPFNFFDRNPALDLRTRFSDEVAEDGGR